MIIDVDENLEMTRNRGGMAIHQLFSKGPEFWTAVFCGAENPVKLETYLWSSTINKLLNRNQNLGLYERPFTSQQWSIRTKIVTFLLKKKQQQLLFLL